MTIIPQRGEHCFFFELYQKQTNKRKFHKQMKLDLWLFCFFFNTQNTADAYLLKIDITQINVQFS